MPLPPLLPRLSPTPPPLRAGGRGNAALLSPGRRRRPALLAVVRAKRKDEASFTDRILDYIEGGPKLRRWYGAPDLLPKDGGAEDEEDESQVDIEEPRDAVLVTNGDSEVGQMVILALILKRARTKALVKDKRTTEEAFGTYVECMVGDMEDKSFTKKALSGVRAVICPADDGFFSELTDLKGVQHIVLLSQGIATKGRISKEDAATICVEALDSIPRKTLIFEVANGDEKVRDWKAWFAEQIKREEEIQ
ncbi:uncharacterized protein [Miscanthus floridulus]|uniref:uncharacterized protein isoform X8 n=1 Tax=Miscanthus floridulus TaxID=154761 RepID=UPI003459AB65